MNRFPVGRASIATLLDLGERARQIMAEGRVRPANRGVLLQTSGSEAGRLHPVPGAGLTLGRGDCDVRLDDGTLSRFHARVSLRDGAYVLEDLGSLNGCYINDRRIKQAVLGDGDRVRLGWGASFRFQLLDEDEEKGLARVYESSVRDAVTGLFNRRHAVEQLTAEIAFSLRHGSELCVVMLDLDHFKRINDAYGHLAGDAVLQHVASLVSRTVRAEDMVARYGGEEIVIVARGINCPQASVLAERVRASVEAAEIPFQGSLLRVTLSAGCSSLALVQKPEVESLFALADARLYQAKARGRNRVVADDQGWS